jgi:hypothetical protein
VVKFTTRASPWRLMSPPSKSGLPRKYAQDPELLNCANEHPRLVFHVLLSSPQPDAYIPLLMVAMREGGRLLDLGLIARAGAKWATTRKVMTRKAIRSCSETCDAPTGETGVKDHCRPQSDTGQSRAKSCIRENRYRRDVVEQHGGDDAGCGAAVLVLSRAPTGNAQREQRGSGHAAKGDARAGDFGTKQQLDDGGGHDQ